MDTIKTYLDNIFRALPQTEPILRMKADLLGDMEAKYAALRAEGKSDAQAVAQVIGEFGNIDELLSEMGIVRPDPAALPQVSLDAARDFVSRSHGAARQVGLSVMTIILSVAVMIGWYGRIETTDGAVSNAQGLAPVIFLLIMVALAVAVIIRSSSALSDYGYIDEGAFVLDYDARQALDHERREAKRKSITGISAGVALCILATALLLVIVALNEAYSLYGVCLLLAIVSLAVFLFIRIGGMQEPYNKLMMLEEYRIENRANLKRQCAVISALWMVMIAVFLGWGFLYDGWKISWVVFPIAGVLTGAVSAFMDRSS